MPNIDAKSMEADKANSTKVPPWSSRLNRIHPAYCRIFVYSLVDRISTVLLMVIVEGIDACPLLKAQLKGNHGE